MNESSPPSELDAIGRIGQTVVLLSDIRDHFLGIENKIIKIEMPEILMAIIKDEHMWYMINFTFAYYGVKRQLPNKEQYTEGIKGMKELMGLEKKETKSKIAAIMWNGMGMQKALKFDLESAIECFKEALKHEPESISAFMNLSMAYQEDGDFTKAEETRREGLRILNELEKQNDTVVAENPQKEFKKLTKLFYEKRKIIHSFTTSREIYKSMLRVNIGILSIIEVLLNDIRNCVRGKDHKIPEDQIANVLEDFINDIFEWLSILCGLVYYNLRDELGDEKLIGDLLDELLWVLGNEEHRNLQDQKKPIDPAMLNMMRRKTGKNPKIEPVEINSEVSHEPTDLWFTYPKGYKPTEDHLINSYRVVKSLGHSHHVDGIALSTDGKYLASASWDNTVKIWDTETAAVLIILRGHTGWVTTVAISPDGKYVVSGGMDRLIIIWDLKTGKKLHVLKEHEGSVWSLAISPDSQFFVSGSEDRNLIEWDIKTGKVRQIIMHWQDGHQADIETVKLSSEGTFVTSASIDNTIKIWDLEEIKNDFESRPVTIKVADRPTSIDVFSDDISIIGSSWDNTVRIWDTILGQEKNVIKTEQQLGNIVLSPDMKYFAASPIDEERSDFSIWEISSGEIVKTIDGHEGMIKDLVYSTDGNLIYSASEDNTIKAWDVKTSESLKTFQRADDQLFAMMVHPDGRHFLSSSNSRSHSIDMWVFPAGNVERQLLGHNAQIKSIKVSKKGDYIVSASVDGIIKIWRTSSGNLSRSINSGFDRLSCMQLSHDWHYIVGGSMNGTIKVWDFDTGEEVAKFTLREGDRYSLFRWISAVDISRENKYLAAGSQDGKVYMWEFGPRKLVREILPLKPSIRITAIKFSYFGDYLAISSLAPIVYLWDVKTGEFFKAFVGGHEKYITTLAFSYDNFYLISGSDDNRVMVHSIKEKESYGPFQLSSEVIYANLIPNGSYLIAGDRNGEVYVWDYKKRKMNTDIRLIFLENLEMKMAGRKVGEITEYNAIESYRDGKIDTHFNDNEEILKEGYLDKQLMEETELFMLNGADLYEGNRALLVYVYNSNGITLRDVAEAFQNYLPKYGDHRFYEGMHYIGDYKKIPVYRLYLGS